MGLLSPAQKPGGKNEFGIRIVSDKSSNFLWLKLSFFEDMVLLKPINIYNHVFWNR